VLALRNETLMNWAGKKSDAVPAHLVFEVPPEQSFAHIDEGRATNRRVLQIAAVASTLFMI
jgi:hypothetical protein